MSNRGNVETSFEEMGSVLRQLAQPFEMLTIQRPMQLFSAALGLQPGVAGLPSEEFLAPLVCGRRTYLAAVREIYGKDFKNFQNYARGRVETTAEVRKRLLEAVNGDHDILETTARWLRAHPSTAELGWFVRAVEGVFARWMPALLSGSLTCKHCQAELISQPAVWWGQQACGLGAPEYRFVDRILLAQLAVSLLPLVGTSWARKEHEVSHLAGLCEPGAHPFKHWLTLVGRQYRAKDLTALATRARLSTASPETLQRSSRGEMLTTDVIAEVTASLQDPKSARNLGMHARSLAFLVDFVLAAHCGPKPLERDVAQGILKDRLLCLYRDLQLANL